MYYFNNLDTVSRDVSNKSKKADTCVSVRKFIITKHTNEGF